MGHSQWILLEGFYGEIIFTFIQKQYTQSEISSIHFDDVILLAGTWQGDLEFWPMQHARQVLYLSEHSGSVNSVCLNGLHFVSGSMDKTIRGIFLLLIV